jgi:hypothetical protein
MKFSIHSRASMRSALFVAVAGLALGTVPAIAQQRPADAKTAEPAKPITQQDVGAKDVALTPLSDLNLRKGEIPQLLLDAQDDPYTLAGMARCPQIAAAVGELDAVLGDDIDVAQAKKQSMSAGRVAQSVAGSFIPFRDLRRHRTACLPQGHRPAARLPLSRPFGDPTDHRRCRSGSRRGGKRQAPAQAAAHSRRQQLGSHRIASSSPEDALRLKIGGGASVLRRFCLIWPASQRKRERTSPCS